MIYHNTSLRAPLRRPVRDFPPEPQNHTPYPLKTAQNGADDFWGRESLCSRLPGVRFQCDPILNCQKQKYDFHENGERAGIYCRIVKRWRGIGAQPWPGDQRDETLCKDADKRQSAKRFVYTSGSLVAFWIYAPFLPFMEKRLCALLLFLVL